MRTNTAKLISIGAGLLACGWVGGSDLNVPSLGGCVAQLPEEGEFAIKICEARRARALMTVRGSGRCAGTSRVTGGRIHCSKSDSSSGRADTGTAFAPYHVTLNSPVSIGSIEAFYAGRNAGESSRLRVIRNRNGRLEIKDRVVSGTAVTCTISAKSNRCSVGSTGRNGARAVRQYTLGLDGVRVTGYTQSRSCVRIACPIATCIYKCSLGSHQETVPQLHLWN